MKRKTPQAIDDWFMVIPAAGLPTVVAGAIVIIVVQWAPTLPWWSGLMFGVMMGILVRRTIAVLLRWLDKK